MQGFKYGSTKTTVTKSIGGNRCRFYLFLGWDEQSYRNSRYNRNKKPIQPYNSVTNATHHYGSEKHIIVHKKK